MQQFCPLYPQQLDPTNLSSIVQVRTMRTREMPQQPAVLHSQTLGTISHEM